MSVRGAARATLPALVILALVAPEAGAASPAAPTNLRITASTSSTVTLAWDASKSGSIAYYMVLEKSTWSHFNVPASQTTFTRTRLAANVTHSWVVRAVDTRGNGSRESNTVSYKTPPDVTAPSTPTLSAPFVGAKRVELDWTDSVDDVSGVTYTVNVNGSPARTDTLSHAVLDGLSPSTSYAVNVSARDRAGNSVTSNTLTVTTPAATDTSPPSAPGNLMGLEVGSCEGWLSWDPSTDDVDPASTIRYDAYVNGVFDSATIGYTKSIVYATKNGTNTYTIVAVDSAGNESQPSTVEIPNMFLC